FHVTGVQTCALPICPLEKVIQGITASDSKRLVLAVRNEWVMENDLHSQGFRSDRSGRADSSQPDDSQCTLTQPLQWHDEFVTPQIGRASCRDSGDLS